MGRNLAISILWTLLISFQSCHAGIYHDPVNEAIVIDDSVTTSDTTKFDPAVAEESTLRPEGYCITANGGNGNCIPLRDCFPYMEYMQEESVVDSIINGYIGDVVNSTESCSDENGYICCPNYSYTKLPAKKPSVSTPTPTPTRTNVRRRAIDCATPPPVASTTTTTTTAAPSSTTTTTTTIKPIKPQSTCGSYVKGTDDFVVGGRYASKGEFPWAVAITDNGRQFCGGSLIKPNYIVTAAHCVQQLQSATGIRVLIGAHNLGAAEAGRESRGVTKILYHRDFSMRHLQNDVALLQLSSPVQYTKYIQPVCLNTAELSYKEKVDLAGWGKQGSASPPSQILKTVNMALISPEQCKRTYQGTSAPPLTQGMICAGEKVPLKDACNGDSGGPLTLKTGDGSAKQVGIVSWGIGCGEKPGVFTKVSHYLPWINKNSK